MVFILARVGQVDLGVKAATVQKSGGGHWGWMGAPRGGARMGEEVVGQDHRGPCISVLRLLQQMTTNGVA